MAATVPVPGVEVHVFPKWRLPGGGVHVGEGGSPDSSDSAVIAFGLGIGPAALLRPPEKKITFSLSISLV
jgi:hypothetical protein